MATVGLSVPVGMLVLYVPVLAFLCTILYGSCCSYKPIMPKNPKELGLADGQAPGENNGRTVPLKFTMLYVRFRCALASKTFNTGVHRVKLG